MPDLPVDFPTLKTLDGYLHNLPAQPAPFIGREKEVAAIVYLLCREDIRLLTLTGPGGSGKTRLGLQVVKEMSDKFSDGVYFVDLAPLSEPKLVIFTIANTLEFQGVSGQLLFDTLKALLRDKQILLMLDNFEQVARAAPDVAELLAECPGLKVLVTSRMTLHLQAEQEFAVPPLSLPDLKYSSDLIVLSQYEAVALFIQRARAVQPNFQLTNSNAHAVAEICMRLDGLPLAIELAATRIRLFTPQALLSQLGQRLALLTKGAVDAPARQRTLRDTIAWSYNLLDEAEKNLFRKIAVFVGGCTLEAIQSVCAEPGVSLSSVLDLVESLIDKNLLRQIAPGEAEEPRLVMLETIREYGLEVLSANGEMETTRQAHENYYLGLAEEAAQGYSSTQASEWLERLEREYENLRSAMEWSLQPLRAGLSLDIAYQFGESLTEFWRVRGFYSEARAFFERVLTSSEGLSASVRGKTLRVAASFAFQQGDFDRAEILWQKSLALYRELDDIQGIADSLQGIGLIADKKGDHTVGVSLLEESLALAKGSGDMEAVAWSLFALADSVSSLGDYLRGNVLFEESLAIFRKLENKRGIADCLRQSALFLFFGAQGDQAIVHQRLEESLVIYRDLGDKEGMVYYCWVKGWAVFKQGDITKAHDLLEQCLVLCRETGMRWHTCGVLAFLGRIEAVQGDFAVAHNLLEESLAEARTLDDWSRASCLERLAVVVSAQGEHIWSVRLLSVAESLRENYGVAALPAEQADYEPAIAAARASLGQQAFVAALAEGRRLTFEQVLAVKGSLIAASSVLTIPTVSPSEKLTTYPDGLTAREVEVLRLVAKGLSNAEIADQLVISLLTVKAHMRSIYNKLGISSRSAATRYAIEHQIV